MNLDRRQFLRCLGLVALVAPVAPTYFFAPKGGWKLDGLSNKEIRKKVAFAISYPQSYPRGIWDEKVPLKTDSFNITFSYEGAPVTRAVKFVPLFGK